MSRSSLRAIFGLAPVIVLFVLSGGCGQKENKFAPPPPPQVTVSRPLEKPVTDYLELTGNTQAVEQVELQARIEGFLTSIHFKDGDFVKKGDLLFIIEQQQYQAKVQEAEGRLATAEALLLRAQEEYDRQLYLFKENATAKSEVERWRAQRDAAQASVEEAKANLELAKINLGYTRVTAPFDGRMDRHLVDPGNLVGAGKPTPLGYLTRLDPMYAYFSVNERDLIRVMEERRREGKTMAQLTYPVYLGIAGEEGYPHEGRLDFASSTVDPNTGTLLLRGIFSNPRVGTAAPRLLAGMFARIRIPVNVRDRALLVSERALGTDQGGRYLLVVNDQSVVEQRSVKVGALIEGMRVIEDGLKGDEWVVVDGLQRARPGAKITPVQQQATAPASAPPSGSEQAKPAAATASAPPSGSEPAKPASKP
jgi:membrane fusion protein, multidrug efflux system